MSLPERRTGFDRRNFCSRSPVLRFLDHGVRLLAAEPWRLSLILLLVFATGVLDLLFTADALAAGATEANPVMANLFARGYASAAAFKLTVTLLVVASIWRLRKYRRVLEASLAIVAGMSALIAYHILMRALFA